MKNVNFKSYDGTNLTLYIWDNVKNPKGVVQLIHGMSEYLKRYDDFAKFLNENGYIVFGDDHRGHGKTAGSVDKVGKVFGDGDIFNQTVLDELEILKKFKNKYKNLKYFVFSHSYGSFITQRLMQINKIKINGYVLCGSANMHNQAHIKFGKFVAGFGSVNSPAKFIANVSFKNYNKKFKSGAWITRDEKIAKEYYSDPLCATTFSKGFYKSLFKGMLNNYTKFGLNSINKDIPIFIISGKEDPVSKYGKLAESLYDLYKKVGVKSVDLKLYEDCRHELINELNKKEVYSDLLNFFNKYFV